MSSPPAASFLAGWRKLPDELKTHVLRYALPQTMTFNADAFAGTPRNDRSNTFETYIMPLLTCPEIAGIATELLYKHYAVCIKHFGDHSGLLYPSPTINVHVRRLHIQITLSVKNLGFLRKLSEGHLGFPNLHYVALNLRGLAPEHETTFNSICAMKPIVIRTRVLEVRYNGTGRLLRVLGLPNSACESLETRIFNIFDIHWEEEKVQKSWKRYYYPDSGKVQRTADGWPSGLDSCFATGFNNPRWTQKAMWIQSQEVRFQAAKYTISGFGRYMD
jgi:hypothetical protein